MPLSQKGVERLLEVKDYILAHSVNFDMADWYKKLEIPEPDGCGTVACIAGWVCELNKEEALKIANAAYLGIHIYTDIKDIVFSEVASKLLGLDGCDSELFYESTWPSDISDALADEYYAMKGATEPDSLERRILRRQLEAKYAGVAIDRFIAENKPASV